MRKKLLSILLILGLLLTLSVNAFAVSGQPVVSHNQKVDVLVTADDTYGSHASDFKTALQSELAKKNISDINVSSVDTDVNLSNFDDWYVYDHYYNPNYPANGSAPADWDTCSGRHPYYYYKEANIGTSQVTQQQINAVETTMHNTIYPEYQILIYACQSSLSDLSDFAAQKYPYSGLTGSVKTSADQMILEIFNQESGLGFKSINDVLSYYKSTNRDDQADDLYSKPYSQLTADEQAAVDAEITNEFQSIIERYYNQSIAITLLTADEQKALADEYLIINQTFEGVTSDSDYANLSDTQKSTAMADLAAYKNSYYDNLFTSAYFTQGMSSNTFSGLTDTEKVTVENNYYYNYYITADSHSDAYETLAETAAQNIYFTDVTTPGALSACSYRSRHIYTDIDGNGKASMTFVGYSSPGYKDFLLYPTTDTNKKTVDFDIDASKVLTHTLEGAGFLINSGIDAAGYIHGYILFYYFTPTEDDSVPPTSGTVYLLKINDGVTADDLHAGTSSEYLENNETKYTSVVASQDITFDETSLKKHVSLTIAPDSITATDTDYTDAGGTTLSQSPTVLFSGAETLDGTNYNGYGPIVSYYSHNCSKLSAFTFSNLKMSRESSSVESLRNASYIDGAKKVYVVLTGNAAADTSTASYKELLTRLKQDKVFYVTNGDSSPVTDSKNGYRITGSSLSDQAADAASYIAGIESGTTAWDDSASLPSGAPVAVFDVTGSDGNQIMTVNKSAIGDDGLTLKFGNLDKSTPAGSITGYTYTVFDPSGNPITPGGQDGNEIALQNTSPVGTYTFKLAVTDGTNNSETASRSVSVYSTIDIGPAGNIPNPYTAGSLSLNIASFGSNVASYSVGKAVSGGSVQYGSPVTLEGTKASESVTLTLDSGTYTLYVKTVNADGDVAVWSAPVSIAGPENPEPNPGTGTVTPSNYVNANTSGSSQPAGTLSKSTKDGQTVTTITLDKDLMNKIIAGSDKQATISIPISGGSDIASGVLTGQTAKDLAAKGDVLKMTTDSAEYSLPASQIDIDSIAQQFGQSVSPSDITITINISTPSSNTLAVVKQSADNSGFTLVVPGVNFEVSYTCGTNTITAPAFSAYVERMVAIPDGVDPSRITTGVVVSPDGTIRHVPTKIIEISGKYYAEINSLTNSTYAVIWNPIEFSDVANHWAKDAVNDMGSRLVVNGVGNDNFSPDTDMTRAEFAATMIRALGLAPETGTSSFSDVADSDWYCGYVKAAASHGIITGYDSKTFGPNDKITREQAMTMIARSMAITKLDTGLTDSEKAALLNQFTDGTDVSAYAGSSVAICIKTGIVSGEGSGTISPKNCITRAEVAVMAQKLLKVSGLI